MKKLLLGMMALAACVATHSAGAADLPASVYKAPPPPPPFTWTGAYVGINGGYGWGRATWEYQNGALAGVTANHDTTGWLAGITTGYNYQVANWVLGYESDIDTSFIHGSNSGATECGTPFVCETKLLWFGTTRARLGLAWDRFLIYGTGGVATAYVRGQTRDLTGVGHPPSGLPWNGESNALWGWTAGAGIEWAFAENFSAKIEYLHFDIGKQNFVVDAPFIARIGETGDIVRAGINYKFSFLGALLGFGPR